MKSPLASWSVVVGRAGVGDRDISTVAKNAHQWVTAALSRWPWMPCAVMGYWLCKCEAACPVCSPDQSINGDRRVIFNSGNDVDHSMLSLSVVLFALVDMLAFSFVSTVALSFEQSGGDSTVGAELVSPNSYPGQLMRFEVCLCMEAVLKVCVRSSVDMWLHKHWWCYH